MKDILNLVIIKQSYILALLMGANILFGTSVANQLNTFTREKCVNGIRKATVLYLGITAIALAGSIDPELITLDLTGTSITLKQALETLMTGAIALYAYKAINNLAKLLGVSTKVVEPKPEVIEIDNVEELLEVDNSNNDKTLVG